jgi:hypothetical protein
MSGAYRRYLLETNDPMMKHKPIKKNKTGNAATSEIQSLLNESEDEDSEVLFRCSMPYSLPRPMNTHDLHNKFVFVVAQLPVGISGAPSRRLQKIKEEMNLIKHRPDPLAQVVIQHIAKVLLGKTVLSFLGLQVSARTTITCTNVPGPQEKGYIAGKEVLGFHPGE